MCMGVVYIYIYTKCMHIYVDVVYIHTRYVCIYICGCSIYIYNYIHMTSYMLC